MNRRNVRYPFAIVLVAVVLVLAFAQPLAAKDDNGEIEVEGTVLSIDAAAGVFQVQGKDGNVYTIVPPAGFDLGSLKVGDTVEVKGTLNADGSISALIIKLEPAGDEVDKTLSYYCVQSQVQHPVGARLAAGYDVPYEELQAWFCQGLGWGQVKLALRTAKLTGGNYAELLEARLAGQGWGRIWQGLNLIGRARHDKTAAVEAGGPQVGSAGGPAVVKAKGKPVAAGQSAAVKAKGKPVAAGQSGEKKENGKPSDGGRSDHGKGKK